MATLSIDFGSQLDELTEDGVITEVQDWARTHAGAAVTVRVLELHGPGGGHPYVAVDGAVADVERVARAYAADAADDEAFWLSNIER